MVSGLKPGKVSREPATFGVPGALGYQPTLRI